MRKIVRVALAVATTSTLIFGPGQQADAAGQGLAASYVFGQSGDFTSGAYAATANRLQYPRGSVVDAVRHRLFVADASNHRVLVFNLNTNNSIPDDTADLVLGQADLTSAAQATTQSGMSYPSSVAYDATNDRLYVVDKGNHRILVFATGTITNGMNASVVLGQPNFTTSATNTTQSGLNVPFGVALGVNDRYVFVADYWNNRDMVWDSNALATGMNATYAIGQGDFVSRDWMASQTRISGPKGVTVDRATNRLYVAEADANRVSVFDLGAIATGISSAFVFGQANFTATAAAAATSAQRLNNPQAVTIGAGKVFVLDVGNQRVVAYDVATSTSGATATSVYGQPDFTSNGNNTDGRSASTLSYPGGVNFDPSTYRLYVSDEQNNRVLVFDPVVSGVTVSGTVSPIFTFSVGGRSTTCNGQSATGFQSGSTSTAVNLGALSSTQVNGAAQDLSVTSNAAGGFTVFVRTTNASPVFRDSASHAVADLAGTVASPGSAPVAGTEGFGFTTSDTSTPFTSNTWAKLTGTNGAVAIGPANVTSKSACVGYAAAIANTTIAGTYSVPVIYTAVPAF